MDSNKIIFFDTCVVSHLYPHVSKAAKRLLKELSLEIVEPSHQVCCGLPAFSSGHWDIAKAMARCFLVRFEKEELPIVIPSGSCTAMVRVHYLKLFEDDPFFRKRAEKLAERTFELSEFLVEVVGVNRINGEYRGRVAFHDSCQALRVLNIKEQPTLLLNRIQGIRAIGPDFRVDDGERCCGFGGLFHLKYPEISAAIRESKINRIISHSPDILVGIDMGCMHNLKKGLKKRNYPIRAMHMAELLWEAQKGHAQR